MQIGIRINGKKMRIVSIVTASVGLFAAVFIVFGGSTADVAARPTGETIVFKQLGFGQLVLPDAPGSVCPGGIGFRSVIGTPLVHPETGERVGTIDECIIALAPIENGPGTADDGFATTSVAFFTFDAGNGFYPEGTVVSKDIIVVTQPCYDACPDVTHSTTGIPPENANNINTTESTGAFTNAVGRARLSGSSDVNGIDFSTFTGSPFFDCFWEITTR